MADTLPLLADVPDSATAREVASQPDVWRRTLALPDAELAALPAAGEAVLGLGAGTSYYVMDSYARRRQELGAGLTRAAIASELDDQGAYDRVLYLSRSGTTSDVLALHPRFAGRVRTTALSGTPGSPIVEAAVSGRGHGGYSFPDRGSAQRRRVFGQTRAHCLREDGPSEPQQGPGQAGCPSPEKEASDSGARRRWRSV